MKKWERVLLGIFGCFIGIFAVDILYRHFFLEIPFDYYMFDTVTSVLAWIFIVSVLGTIAILISCRLRKRTDTGLKPVSKLYRASFFASFIPFLLLFISSLITAVSGFTFLGSTSYGFDAFWSNIVILGVYVFGVIIPVFPLCIFWQILYLIKRRRYRKLMKESS